MIYPNYTVDNFFDNPEEIVDLANSISFPHKGNNSPGARTEPLHEEHMDFFNWSGRRIISVIYPNGQTPFTARAFFQKIPKTVGEVDFIHQDTDVKLTAIVYLNKKGCDGTSLFKPKTFLTPDSTDTKKYDYYSFPEKYKGDKLKELQIEKETLRAKFNETVSVSGIYNRLFMFDGHQYHAQHLSTQKEERLTYIVFFSRIESWNAPLEGMRKI